MKGVYDALCLPWSSRAVKCGHSAQHLPAGVDDVPLAVRAFRARDKRTHEFRDSFAPAKPLSAEAGLVHALGPNFEPMPISADVTYDRKR